MNTLQNAFSPARWTPLNQRRWLNFKASDHWAWVDRHHLCGDPKVSQLGHILPIPLLGKQDILWLEVQVRDIQAMDVDQPRGNLLRSFCLISVYEHFKLYCYLDDSISVFEHFNFTGVFCT